MVLPDIVDALGGAYDRSSVDDFGSVWSEGAEAGLFRAYCWAGGPTSAGIYPYLGRGRLRIRRRWLGGKSAGGAGSTRLYRVSRGDDLDVESALFLSPRFSFFIGGSSLSLMFLRGLRRYGFTQSRLDALGRYWRAVCRHGPCGPVQSLELLVHWIPPDLYGFYRWVMDVLELLNGFVKQVVITRRDTTLLSWANWLRGDLVAVTQFLAFVGSFLPQEAELDLLPISGRELMPVLGSPLLVAWMVGPGMR